MEKEIKSDENKESIPAVKKDSKGLEIKENKIELEREYVIPLRRGTLKVARTRRAKKAVRLVREFLAKHMRVEDRDLRKVKIDQYLNEELWFRGIRKPANKIKVKAIKKNGIVYAELFELPDNLKFAKARQEKMKMNLDSVKTKPIKHEDKKEETKESKEDEKEKKEASVEVGKKIQKDKSKAKKHTTSSEHEHKTHPRRQSLKK